MRPFRFGSRVELIPTFEMFNTFNNKNNVNPLVTPALFNFDGFLRLGVGDPRQAQLSVKLVLSSTDLQTETDGDDAMRCRIKVSWYSSAEALYCVARFKA